MSRWCYLGKVTSSLLNKRFPMMKVNWRLVSAIATLLLISGCSQASITRATPSSTPTITPTASIDRNAVYAEAAAYLQSFLASWQKNGAYAANQKYLAPSMGSTPRQGNPVLIAGTVTSTQSYNWVSADHFTVMVDLDLRFSGNTAAWGNGINTRFVTFTRLSASAPYLMTLASGPPGPIDHSEDYTKATAYLQSFLNSWQKNGLYAAVQKYFDLSRWPIQKQGNPVLIAGTVKRLQPYSWVSADNFMVLVQLDLRFSKGFSEGDGGWGSGTNDRFFTFVRASASAPYKMTLATGP